MKRLTETGKWDDNFFMALPPLAKLLITYLHDRCDESGIIDCNMILWETHLKMSKIEIKEALTSLQPLLLSDKKQKLWIKHFLYLQNKLPLNPANTDHAFIIEKLKRNLTAFNSAREITDIINTADWPETTKNKRSKHKEGAGSNSKNNVADNPPTLEEWTEEYLKQYPEATEGQIETHYGNCVSKKWVVGTGNKTTPMKDWKGAIRTGVGKLKIGADEKASGQKKSKTQITFNLANQV